MRESDGGWRGRVEKRDETSLVAEQDQNETDVDVAINIPAGRVCTLANSSSSRPTAFSVRTRWTAGCARHITHRSVAHTENGTEVLSFVARRLRVCFVVSIYSTKIQT